MSAIALPRLWTPVDAGAVWTPGRETPLGMLERVLHHLRHPRSQAAERARELVLFAGFSDTAEIDVLNSVFDKHASINLYATPFLALTRAAVADVDTGTTIAANEANYTGYGRLAIPTSSMNSAGASGISNSQTLTFPNCTAGSSSVIGWAVITASTGGFVVVYGSCSPTTINTTQTPPTVAAGALSVSLD